MWERHRDITSRLYNKWKKMRHRCRDNKKYPSYINIEVCSEWDNSYPAFKEWAHLNGYVEGLTIDRIDNNGDYTPSNCRFITLEANSGRPRKVSEEDVEEILRLIDIGRTQQVIADTFDISQAVVSTYNLKRRK